MRAIDSGRSRYRKGSGEGKFDSREIASIEG